MMLVFGSTLTLRETQVAVLHLVNHLRSSFPLTMDDKGIDQTQGLYVTHPHTAISAKSWESTFVPPCVGANIVPGILRITDN